MGEVGEEVAESCDSVIETRTGSAGEVRECMVSVNRSSEQPKRVADLADMRHTPASILLHDTALCNSPAYHQSDLRLC